MSKVTPFLMFNDQLEAAMEFYAATFPDSEIREVARKGEDGPVTSAEFVVGGQVFMGFNGGPTFNFSSGFSLYVDCEDQAEVDRYWDALIEAGAEPIYYASLINPFTHAVELMRYAAYGKFNGTSVLVVVGVTVVAFALAARGYNPQAGTIQRLKRA